MDRFLQWKCKACGSLNSKSQAVACNCCNHNRNSDVKRERTAEVEIVTKESEIASSLGGGVLDKGLTNHKEDNGKRLKSEERQVMDCGMISSLKNNTSSFVAHFKSVGIPSPWLSAHDGSVLFRQFPADYSLASHSDQTSKVRGIAAFDFDGCLMYRSFRDPTNMSIMFPNVKDVLQKFHSKGFRLIIISNELMERYKRTDIVRRELNRKFDRFECFAKDLKVPIEVYIATKKNEFRKGSTKDMAHTPPRGGVKIWNFMLTNPTRADFEDVGGAPSFFVGDAAGRPGDHSDCDKNFAKQIGIPFFTPEQIFGDSDTLQSLLNSSTKQ